MTLDHWRQLVMHAATEAVNRDQEPLNLIAEMLYQSEEAKQELRKKGYGCTGMSLLETIKREVPHA
jgi:hypothetical protein